jgi:hypothetical protein
MPCRLGGTVPPTNKRGINKKRRYGEVSTNPQQGGTCQPKQQQRSPQKSHYCPYAFSTTSYPVSSPGWTPRTCTGGRHRTELDSKRSLLVLCKRQSRGQTTQKVRWWGTSVLKSGSLSSGGASAKRNRWPNNNLRLSLCRRGRKDHLLPPSIPENRAPQGYIRAPGRCPEKAHPLTTAKPAPHTKAGRNLEGTLRSSDSQGHLLPVAGGSF